jgi:uncharacterized membrane protein YqiK
MKEYTIILKFSIESKKADYEDVSEFAEKLTEKIMNDDSLVLSDGIEITEITVNDVEDNNDYLDLDEEKYLDEEEDY